MYCISLPSTVFRYFSQWSFISVPYQGMKLVFPFAYDRLPVHAILTNMVAERTYFCYSCSSPTSPIGIQPRRPHVLLSPEHVLSGRQSMHVIFTEQILCSRRAFVDGPQHSDAMYVLVGLDLAFQPDLILCFSPFVRLATSLRLAGSHPREDTCIQRS